ncbi:PIN domain-containing protein [Actinoallomurus acanthiterrae]
MAQTPERWEEQVSAGLIAVCPIIELEVLFSARSMDERQRLRELLRAMYGWVPMPDGAYQRAAEVQEALTKRAQHRCAGPVDLLVAATAELENLTVLHYDRDYETIARVTGQPTRWLARPGTLS